MIYGLTNQQRNLLNFLRQCENDGRPTPSYDEMAAALELKSKGGIHRLLEGLEERGCVRWLKFRARTVQVTVADDTDMPSPLDISANAMALRPEIEGLLKEAKRHANAIYGREADYPLIMGVWLWHAMRGTSPGFLPKDHTA